MEDTAVPRRSTEREDCRRPCTYSFVSALSMRGGYGANSYAHNSLLQRKAMVKARPVLVETIKNKLGSYSSFPSCFRIADLGCSSGPNSFMTVYEIIMTISDMIKKRDKNKRIEFEIFLNDLPENDFNTSFKFIPFLHEKVQETKGLCFVSGVPGSFYSRLFPSNSLHFVHSCYSLHFLSKVPDGLENKGNVYMSKSTPPSVHKAYLHQFKRDFFEFLRLRSEEVIPGGCMFLTFIGRNTPDPSRIDCCHFWVLLSKSLRDLVDEGMMREADLDSFNMPFYDPYEGEVKEIIQNEGSFEINELETFRFDLSYSNNRKNRLHGTQTGLKEANCIRAVTEPMLASHFGDAIIDRLFKRYAKHVAEHVNCRDKTTANIVVSLTKKIHA